MRRPWGGAGDAGCAFRHRRHCARQRWFGAGNGIADLLHQVREPRRCRSESAAVAEPAPCHERDQDQEQRTRGFRAERRHRDRRRVRAASRRGGECGSPSGGAVAIQLSSQLTQRALQPAPDGGERHSRLGGDLASGVTGHIAANDEVPGGRR